jgi:hypothetical protein
MLIDFLSDVIVNMDNFREDIQTIFVYPESVNHFVATGNHPKRLLFYRVQPHEDLSAELLAPVYLGALPYLRAILSSSLIKEEGTVKLTYREQGEKKICVESMNFLAKRLESQFQCTNPHVLNEKDRVKQFPRPDDGIFFPITKAMRKDFDEVARFGTPKADMRLFTLVFDGTYVRAMFGGGTHTTTLVLADTVTGNTDVPITKQVSLDRFRLMLKLASENDNAKGAFHPMAVWVDFDTAQSLHTIVTPTIREQTR